HNTRGRGAWCLWTEVAGMRTGVAMRLCGEACKGFGLTMALWHWGCGLSCWRAWGGVAWPRPMEHEAQPYKSDQHQLVEKEMGDHDKTPSDRWRNEGILSGFSGCRISRSEEVHYRTTAQMQWCRNLTKIARNYLTVLHRVLIYILPYTQKGSYWIPRSWIGRWRTTR